MLAYDRQNTSGRTLTASPDLTAIAVVHVGDDGRWGVWISAPIGSELKRYSPDPFATRDVFNASSLRFSPDGKSILLFRAGEQGREESWLLPYPPDPSRPPYRVLDRLSAYVGIGWLPDSRRVVVSMQASIGGTN